MWKRVSYEHYVLLFLIKAAFVSICPKKQSFDPRWSSAHLFTNGIQRNAGAAFDDEFIMDMTDDLAVPQPLHGIGKDVPADCLDDILHEFRAVTLNACPLACSNPFIGHAVRAKLVYPHAWFDIAEPSAGWKIDKEHPSLAVDAETMCLCGSLIDNRLFDSGIH